MFLDSEVLFKNGPFAFIWMVGNGELKKGKKGKYTEAIVKTKVVALW